ncbi:hypothetical protein CXG81DRAFT_14979 [Caulochytrium protostelioides]|uniref:Mitochondrial Rho GTPase n=1 Tax=Caulochytrium protostelioides TaxID=1555241 RepID=A0A4P9WZU8_9FUNG|nr:hypothetical protein CXG81DRAFT_14979 [Caulochytrium protostelioides]|eukprot:RKO99119.1 hypothetical protein CXG81DRAFT_14979 [Caulochytrium protostelioides]
MGDAVRILLVGDDQVGKSTLVMSLLTEEAVPHVYHVVPEVTIPPDWTREKVTLRIVDSSSRPENRDQLDAEIRRADVICIVHDATQPESLARVASYWLPSIRQLGRNVPVVVVGNKIDLRGPDVANARLEADVLPIMNEFKEVETCIECSAREALNVSEIFYFAQKAVLYPTVPLYDSREHTIKPACLEALRRIFRLCDRDGNGVLDDAEINDFQLNVFGAPLQNHELELVKSVIDEKEPEGLTDGGINELGFLFLHTMFIQKGRLETTWLVLRHYGYGDDLTLREDYLRPPSFVVPPEHAVELAPKGYQFFTELFQRFDDDKDGALKPHELENLFAATAPGAPWAAPDLVASTLTHPNGAVTLQGFLAQWALTTLLMPDVTLAYLAYLGYEGDRTQALRFANTHRTVFNCLVLGATGAGKTALLRGLIQQPFTDKYTPTAEPTRAAVNTVVMHGQEMYLVMQELSPGVASEVLTQRKRLDACDVICLVYDSSDAHSFAYVANLREKYGLDGYPCVFVATKSDRDLVAQKYPVQPDAYCRDAGLAPPLSVSMKESATADLYARLVGVGLDPGIAIPGFAQSHHAAAAALVRYATWTAVSAALVAAAVALGMRVYRRKGP